MLPALSACTGGDKPEIQVEKPAKVLLQEANKLAATRDVKGALKAYAEVERQHPQSEYAKIALATAAEFAYKNLKYTDAISFADSFISYNPNHRLSPRIYYIRALSYYEQISDTGRDQGFTDKALQALNDVILSYPGTKYAINAKYKIDLTRDHLAGKELSVGRFYQQQREYSAALARFNRVVTLYSETSQLPEALARIVETYLALGLKQEAIRTAAILGYNHRGNIWYKYAYTLLKKYVK